MSLINQMLQDLKKQQEEERGVIKLEEQQTTWRDRLPQVPAPLLAGAAFGVLILFCWWLAGTLSSWMFTYETTPLAVVEQTDQPLAESEISEEEFEALLAESHPQPVAGQAELPPEAAEPPAPVESSSPAASLNVERSEPVTPAPREPEPALVKAVAPAPSPVTNPTPVQKSPAKPTRLVRQAVEKPAAPVRKAPARPPSQRQFKTLYRSEPVSAPLPPRIHPDQLPGAVVSSQTIATSATPFGAAEQKFRQGKRAYRENRVDAATTTLQQALKLYPGHLAARELLVDILEMQGQAGEAMALLSRGLEIAPDYMPFKKRQVRLLIDHGDLRAAVETMLNAGMPNVEEDPEAHVLLASLYQRLGEAFLAAQTYRNLLVAWPQTGAFWVGLGTSLEAQALPGEAAKAYRQALQIKDLRRDLQDYASRRLAAILS